jgi:hypothetical protein
MLFEALIFLVKSAEHVNIKLLNESDTGKLPMQVFLENTFASYFVFACI